MQAQRRSDSSGDVVQPLIINVKPVNIVPASTMPSVSDVDAAQLQPAPRPLQPAVDRAAPASPLTRPIEPKGLLKLPPPVSSSPNAFPAVAPAVLSPKHEDVVSRPSPSPSPVPAPVAALPPLQSRVVPIASARPNSQPMSNGHSHGLPPLSPRDPYKDDIAALQASDALHAANVRTQGAIIDGLSNAVNQIMTELATWAKVTEGLGLQMESMGKEVSTRLRDSAPSSVDDRTLELFSTDLSKIQAKANEVDDLRRKIALLEAKIARLEAKPDSSSTSSYLPAPRESILQQPAVQASVPGPNGRVYHPTQTATPPGQYAHIGSREGGLPGPLIQLPPPHPTHPHAQHHGPLSQPQQPTQAPPAQLPAPSAAYGSPVPLASQPPQAGAPAVATSWAAVNANPAAKRANGIDGRQDSLGTPHGSPKRPRLAPIEPRTYERMEVDEASQRYRTSSHESAMANQQTQSPAFHTFSAHETEDGTWRHEQRVSLPPEGSTHSPRGRGRGGRGGRSGRPRKSAPGMGEHPEIGNHEWEKSEWASSQILPEGYYPGLPGTAKGSPLIDRRSSGGAVQPVGRPLSQIPADPYAHTKKTRTKPTRNAEGILIRKDGRPDMRSQSSAANLRKVHARKEAERAQELQQHGHVSGSTGQMSPATPSPLSKTSAAEEFDPSTEEGRHRAIMKQMFPHGVDDYADNLKRQFGSRNNTPPKRNPSAEDDEAATKHSSESELSDPEDEEEEEEEDEDQYEGDASKMDVDEAPLSAERKNSTTANDSEAKKDTPATDMPTPASTTSIVEARPMAEAKA